MVGCFCGVHYEEFMRLGISGKNGIDPKTGGIGNKRNKKGKKDNASV